MVEEVGSGVNSFQKGDQIVSPFTISWLAAATVIGSPPDSDMYVAVIVSTVETRSLRAVSKCAYSGHQPWMVLRQDM